MRVHRDLLRRGLWLGASLLMIACGDKQDAIQLGDGAPTLTGPATYTEHIEPILSSCLPCHGGSTPQKGILLETYAQAKENAAIADRLIQEGRMPPGGGLTQPERDLFETWIDDGLLE